MTSALTTYLDRLTTALASARTSDVADAHDPGDLVLLDRGISGSAEEDGPADEPASDQPDPERLAASGELRRLLEAAVDALPEEFRAVFVLREVEGLSTAETAACLAIRPETAKTRLHRARRMLQENADEFFYLTAMNEVYAQPSLPPGTETDIVRGLYRLSGSADAKVRLLGSGAILTEGEPAAIERDPQVRQLYLGETDGGGHARGPAHTRVPAHDTARQGD